MEESTMKELIAQLKEENEIEKKYLKKAVNYVKDYDGRYGRHIYCSFHNRYPFTAKGNGNPNRSQ